jgi:hypothetical protein
MGKMEAQEELRLYRRRFLGAVAMDNRCPFGPLKQIDAGALSVGYAEAGPADGCRDS